MHRLTKEYEKPEFGITNIKVDGVDVAVQQQTKIDKPFCRLIRFKRFTDDGKLLEVMRAAQRAGGGAAVGSPFDAAARHRAALLQHHKVYITDWVDARMVPVRWPVPPGRLRPLRAGFHPPHRPRGNVISVCQPTVPVLAAVSLMATAGEKTPRTMTMMGGPIDAREVADRGQQPGDGQEPRVVREQRDLQRAAQLSRRRPARSTPASCSTAASWR